MAHNARPAGYSSADVCALTGCTYRQLDYWTRSGLIRPSICEAAGYGTRRRWSRDDLGKVRRLRQAGELVRGRLVAALDHLETIGA